jgi:hypothetical protein
MDPFATAVIGWAANQAGSAGVYGVRRLLGDRQRASLHKVVRAAIESAVGELAADADRAMVREALLAGSAVADLGERDLLDLRDAITRQVGPSLAALRQQGCKLEPGRLVDVLTSEIVAGIKADAARGGLLKPLAELMWQERVAAVLEAAATTSPVPRELPRPIADFTGRAEELAAICGHLGSARQNGMAAICAVDGMSGVGKSVLAIQAACRQVGSFPDGQLYVNLRGATPGLPPLDPLDALGHMLRALGCDPAAIPAVLRRQLPVSGH